MNDFLLTIGTALADSINPCIFSVLIFLLSQLSLTKSKEKAIRLAVVYISTIFISYIIIGGLLFGGFTSAFTALTAWHQPLKIAIVFFVIFAGFVNIKDFFIPGEGISFKIPDKYHKTISSLASGASFTAIALLGILVVLVEFPCSGLMYAALISYFAGEGIALGTFLAYLSSYNLIFILPLVVMSFLYVKGVKLERIAVFKNQYRDWARLIMGIVLVALGYLIWAKF